MTPPDDLAAYEAQQGIVPIAIRPDVIVRVQRLPHDLTPAEADKIARVVLAFGEIERDR